MQPIPDKQLIKIPVKDNGEKLVNIKDYCPKVTIRLAAYIKNEGKQACLNACFIREGTAEQINIAQSLLPKGHRIMLRCGYRPLSLQKKRYLWMYKKLKKKNPTWDKKKLADETSRCVAPPEIVPPHSTGGAVDISIIDAKGRQLDMGAHLGRFNEKTYTDSKEIPTLAKNNRKLLVKVMTEAGFVNYPTEWWHWSYGDRYWSAVKKKKFSIYGGI
jgi:zinc D-Ala-D-Ala dipeptidase